MTSNNEKLEYKQYSYCLYKLMRLFEICVQLIFILKISEELQNTITQKNLEQSITFT